MLEEENMLDNEKNNDNENWHVGVGFGVDEGFGVGKTSVAFLYVLKLLQVPLLVCKRSIFSALKIYVNGLSISSDLQSYIIEILSVRFSNVIEISSKI